MKTLLHSSVRLLVVHCVANRCNIPFSTEALITCGKEKYGQCSYHYYVRRNGDIIPLLPETVRGVHARGYNYCSLGIVYEGGLDEKGHPADTRTGLQKAALWSLLKELRAEYPRARIVGHNELPGVTKACPCFSCKTEYASLQPTESRCMM